MRVEVHNMAWNLRCLLGHKWGPNRTPYLKKGGGFVVCDRCGEAGWIV